MIVCINPDCKEPENPDNLMSCQSCGSDILIEGRYQAIQLLGEGGFAKVYEVRDPKGEAKVIKILTKTDSKAIELFQQEAEVLGRLNHPGIPEVEESFCFYPHGTQTPLHCLVMKKVPGQTLKDWLEKRNCRPIGEKHALQWLAQLAEILAEIHHQQLFHRDIKPSNIMLTPSSQLVLIDFGTVREMSQTYEEKHNNAEITVIASRGYTPLEQVTGQAVPQSDFFALGRTFVYLLTGKQPTDFHDPYKHDLYTDELETWRDAASDISPQLADFADRLMARPVQDRPPTAEAILQEVAELEDILYPSNSSTLTMRSSAPMRAVSKIPETLGDVVSWHAGSVTSVAINTDNQTLISGSGDRSVKVWNLSTGQLLHTLLGHQSSVTSVAISLDGKLLASGSYDKTIRLWKPKTGQLHLQLSAGAQITSVLIDPSNQAVIAGCSDNQIRVWSLTDGKALKNWGDHSSSVTSMAISTDGKIVVTGSSDTTIVVGKIRRLEKHSNTVSALAISPDGKKLVSGSQKENSGEVAVWDLHGGKIIHLLEGHKGAISSLVISPDGQTLFSSSQTDTEIKVWDLDTGREVDSFSAGIKGIRTLAISPDGKKLVSGGDDFAIKVWQIG